MKIVLASGSAIRAKMLRAAGVEFFVVRSVVDEPALRAENPQWTAHDTAENLAAAKAMEVSSRTDDGLVIGADQILLLGQEIFAKPRSVAEARHHLRELRGRTHELRSAVCCALGGRAIWAHADKAELTMRDFSEEFLESYLAGCGNDVLTSVGAYKFEDRGIQLFERFVGSHHTILGLPLLPLLSFLRGRGLIAK